MPTLSLSLATSGPVPEVDTAKAASETEGREGDAAASTNGAGSESTWTRLFQSYLQQNKLSSSTESKSTTKVDSDPKSKSVVTDLGTNAASAPTAPTQPVVDQASLVNAAAAQAQVVARPHVVLQPQPVSSTPTISPQATSMVGSKAVAKQPSEVSTSPVHSSVNQRTVVNTIAARPVSVTVQTAQSPVVSPSIAAAGLTNSSPTPTQPAAVVRSDRSKSQPSSSPTAVQANSQLMANSLSTNPPVTAPTTAEATPAPSSSQALVLPQTMPTEVISALSTAQISTSAQNTQPTAVPSLIRQVKTPSGLATKAGMERSMVLGDNAESEHSAASAVGSSATDGSTNGDKSGSGSGQSSADGAFSSVLSGMSQLGSAATIATNAGLVQNSSQDERIAVVNQISAHIQSMQPSTSDPNTMVVTVQPPHWGDVKISVSLNPQTAGGSISNITATVTASTSEVQGALQEHVQDLKDSLANVGLHLDKLDVGVGTVAAMSQSGSSSGHHSGQQGNSSQQQDFASSWSDGSTGSGGSGSQYQSASSWANADDSNVPVTPSTTIIDSTAGAMPAATVDSSNSARIDMRA